MYLRLGKGIVVGFRAYELTEIMGLCHIFGIIDAWKQSSKPWVAGQSGHQTQALNFLDQVQQVRLSVWEGVKRVGRRNWLQKGDFHVRPHCPRGHITTRIVSHDGAVVRQLNFRCTSTLPRAITAASLLMAKLGQERHTLCWATWLISWLTLTHPLGVFCHVFWRRFSVPLVIFCLKRTSQQMTRKHTKSHVHTFRSTMNRSSTW